jgi:signal transduction histidine kinase
MVDGGRSSSSSLWRPSITRQEPASAATFDLLARSVTHELRQPLSLIVGYAELLATRPFDEAERAALLAELRGAAARLAGSLERLERPEACGMLAFGAGPERRVLDLRS